jgi:hypothetical protein
MKAIQKPLSQTSYKDRDIGCQEALEDAFVEISGSLPAKDIVNAAGGTLSAPLSGLAKRAEVSGWTIEEAEVAISELAQNLLDDSGQE